MKKKLYASPNKKLCGVCAGIADYLNVDPTLVRAVAIIIAIYTAIVVALIAYFVMALIIPKAPDNYYQLYNNTSKRLTKGHEKKIAGVCSGFAEYFDCDTTIIRLLFVLVCLLLGTGLLAYIALSVILPEPAQPYYNQPYQNPSNGQNGPYQQQYYNG